MGGIIIWWVKNKHFPQGRGGEPTTWGIFPDGVGMSKFQVGGGLSPIPSIRGNLADAPTENSNGDTLLYKNSIKYKCRKYFRIYKPEELESTFIEVNHTHKKLIVGCIHRHLSRKLFF